MKKIRVVISIVDCDEMGNPIDSPEETPVKVGSVAIVEGTSIPLDLHTVILRAHDLALKEIIK